MPRHAAQSLNRNRDFNVFWAGQTLSFVGDAFSTVAIPLLVLQLTGSLTQMGVVTALIGARLPASPASPPGRSSTASTAAS